MKKVLLFGLVLLTGLFIGCATTNGVADNSKEAVPLEIRKEPSESGHLYFVKSGPEDFEEFFGKLIFYPTESNSVAYIWNQDCEEQIKKALEYRDFFCFEFYGDTSRYIGLNVNLNENPDAKITRGTTFDEEKKIIYTFLSEKYVGFEDMKNRGFTKKEWDTVKSYKEMTKVFDKYIQDYDFFIKNGNFLQYKQKQRFDENTSKSTDPENTFFAKATSNTYYIRCNNCISTWEEGSGKIPSLAEEAKEKENIVFDYRSTFMGGQSHFVKFIGKMNEYDYKGTIYILQDNWSSYAGEVWLNLKTNQRNYNVKLVGTHSAGTANYSNYQDYKNKNIYAYYPTVSYVDKLPDNYLGDCLGYEPDIWATTADMKKVLENQGLDLTGVTFQ